MGRHLGLPRHHRARAPGELGGLARGLPADPGLRLVEPPRRVRRARPASSTPCRRRPRPSAARGAPDDRDRSRRRRAGGGVPAAALAGAGAGLLVARAWLRRAPDVDGGRKMSAKTTLRIERTFQAPAERGLRRLDQRGGDAPLVPRRARLGDGRGRGRPARRRRRAGGHARPRQGRRARRRRPLHGDRPADTAWRSPGSGTTMPQRDPDRDRLRGEPTAPPRSASPTARLLRRGDRCARTRAAGAPASTTSSAPWRRRRPAREADGPAGRLARPRPRDASRPARTANR